eukprot:INCI6230.2.p1 GENE.INCI6230.2~~INCI6230.2.p1  ORF type:complete len:105 (-),score=10.47 INCI6230.2:30-344(-)
MNFNSHVRSTSRGSAELCAGKGHSLCSGWVNDSRACLKALESILLASVTTYQDMHKPPNTGNCFVTWESGAYPEAWLKVRIRRLLHAPRRGQCGDAVPLLHRGT